MIGATDDDDDVGFAGSGRWRRRGATYGVDRSTMANSQALTWVCGVLSLRHFRLARWCSLSLGGWWPRNPARRFLASAAPARISTLVIFRFGATMALGRSERTTMRPLWSYGVDGANSPDRKAALTSSDRRKLGRHVIGHCGCLVAVKLPCHSLRRNGNSRFTRPDKRRILNIGIKVLRTYR